MTTKPLPRFWKALDELSGAATDRRDWSLRLEDEFATAQRYLRKTGKLATAVECPSPGVDGCPRAVIKLSAGKYRAVCRSEVGQCDAVDLTGLDIAILDLDRRRLQEDLASIFCTQSSSPPAIRGQVVRLGQHAVAAGVGASVLVPTGISLPPSTRARLSTGGHQVISLADVITVDAMGRMTSVQPVEVLLHTLRGRMQARLDEATPTVRIPLPPGTTWGQIAFRLTSTATVICNGPGIPGRQLDPGDLGMRSDKNNEPTLAWTFFVMLAEARGVLAPHSGQPIARVRKQKQTLSEQLRNTFGIDADPIVWDKRQRAYVTAFTVSDDRSKSELSARRRR